MWVNFVPENLIGISEVFRSPAENNSCNFASVKQLIGQYQKIVQKRLKRISFSSGEVLFQKGVSRCDFKGDYVLENIIINLKLPNGNYESFRKYHMNYSYLEGTQLTPITGSEININFNKRLVLTSVDQSNNNGIIPSYKFEYNINNGLPNRFSFSQDHWGFYNALNNNTLVPSIFVPPVYCDGNGNCITTGTGISFDKYADRSCGDRTFLPQQEGTLKTIIYPNSGKSEFQYETQ